MGTVATFMLGVLPNDACMSLFNKCAFKEGEEPQHPNLMKIGEEIVKKCGGIPLAVRTLGSLLYSSIDENEWKRVRDNEIWKLDQKENHILPALKLSYDHLPSHLKQCFVYCSLFPKDYVLTNYQLVHIWMAHGLVQSSYRNEDQENIGMQYFKELASRSFFQDFEVAVGFYRFKMHDLIHDLAVLIAKDEWVTANYGKQSVTEKARHLSFVGFDTSKDEDAMDVLSELGDHVRTIYFPVPREGPSQQFVESSISRFRSLRMLDLSDSFIEILPKNIDDLKHLRYLDLKRCRQMKKLPNSIWKLRCLETLLLEGCTELHELPRGIRHLSELKKLTLTTKQQRLRENEIGCLTSLKYLKIDGCVNLQHLFEDIDRLKVLRCIEILDCPNLMLLPRGIKSLCWLWSFEKLVISNCANLNLDFGIELDNRDHEINGGKRPHLRTLAITGLPNLVQLPQWLLHVSANTLEYLRIANCSNFMALPDPLRNLQSLQMLHIMRCPKLACLPENMQRLTALRELAIRDCPALSERCKQGIGEDWPKIAHIRKIQVDGEIIKPIT